MSSFVFCFLFFDREEKEKQCPVSDSPLHHIIHTYTDMYTFLLPFAEAEVEAEEDKEEREKEGQGMGVGKGKRGGEVYNLKNLTSLSIIITIMRG